MATMAETAAIGQTSLTSRGPRAGASLLMEDIFHVRRFGAVGDGKTLDSPAINKAIEAAAAAGGGTVYFSAGVYSCYSIRLKSNVTLYVDQGATILAADVPLTGFPAGSGKGYDEAEPKTAWDAYQDYGHNHWHNSLIWGEGLHDIAILGLGLIWGKGLSRGVGSDREKLPRAELPGVGNKAIALKLCRNVTLRDFSILKGGHFGILATGVDNFTIDNLKIDTDRDGMDIDCCRNVRVSNCSVNSPWDDGICPKSSYALGYARSTDNVTITNCYVTAKYQLGTMLDGTFKEWEANTRVPRTGRIKCGTESNGGFRNLTISNCVLEGCRGLALESVDGALLEDIAITNITMRELTSAPLFVRLGSRMRGPGGVPVGTLRRVLINNIVSYNSSSPLPAIVSGIPGYPIEDVKISDMLLHQVGGGDAAMAKIDPPEDEMKYPDPHMFGPLPAYGMLARHVKGLELSNVEVKTAQTDARPAFWLNDIQGADFFRVKTTSGPENRFAMRNIRDFRVFGSRGIADLELDQVAEKRL
ncbi:MAG TPA: glycoside hydrolase family 28 protein [Acidobacteriaceae bacterium]